MSGKTSGDYRPLAFTLLLAAAWVFHGHPAHAQIKSKQLASESANVAKRPRFGKVPLYFVENRGQLDSRVAYYVHGTDTSVYFTRSGVTFALVSKDEAKSKPEVRVRPVSWPKKPVDDAPLRSHRWAVKLDFLGANPEARPIGEDRTSAVVSYFKGRRQDWKAGLPTYAKVVYRGLWPGIDLVYYGTGSRLKYDFVVHPGARPEQIRLAYRGASDVRLNKGGDLEIATPAGGFQDARPYAYQEFDGRQVEVRTSYDLKAGTHEYGFRVANYDRSRPLVLDPAVLVYAGYLGGSSIFTGYGIAVDTEGNAYVTGLTGSPQDSFPVAVGPDLTYNGDTSDAFVAKVNAAGTALVYAGYIGGSGVEGGNGIAVDAAGNAYVTGYTSSTQATFPVTIGPDLTHNGETDVFVAKVNAAGTALVYAGYIGGERGDSGRGIAVDASGNAYLTGDTASAQGFPVRVGPDLTFNSTGGLFFFVPEDAFVAKVNAAGTALVYAGYIGGPGFDHGNGIAVDVAGNAYVTGSSSSFLNIPAIDGPDKTRSGATFDGFVAKVNAAGTALVYAGYIGGTAVAPRMGSTGGFGIAVDLEGNAYVTGSTSAPQGFPVTVGPDLSYNDDDAFVAKVNAAGTAFVYAGFIGGSSVDQGRGIAVDRAGNAYVTGGTSSPDFPVFGGPDQTYNGGAVGSGGGATLIFPGDGFVAKVNPSGTALVYAGYIGGTHRDSGEGIAVDGAGNAYVIGWAESTEASFPVRVGPDLTNNGSGVEAFVAKISATGNVVTNAASFGADPVAPGGIVAIFGSDLGPANLVGLTLTPAGLVDNNLAGVRVLFDGVPAPLIYVSATQIGAVVPYSVAGKARTLVEVEYQGRRSFATTVPVVAAGPGIFSADASGRGQGAILNEDGTVNSPSNPAAKGSIIVLFATGEGETNPPGVDGKLAVAPFPKPRLRVAVRIEGLPAELLYAGGAPGFVAGVLQVNARIPSDVSSGDRVSIVLDVGNATSQEGITIAVRDRP